MKTIILDGVEYDLTPTKNYTILSFKVGNEIYKQDSQLKDRFCKKDGKAPFYSSDELLDRLPPAKIHSVRRDIDGVVFTLGDTVEFYNQSGTVKVVKSNEIFSILPHKGNSIYIWIGSKEHPYGVDFKQAELVEEVDILFTTEDGVEIKDGDSYYYVNPAINYVSGIMDTGNYSSHMKYFSTEEAAKDWIIMNKPCLCINDIFKLGCGIGMPSLSLDKYKEIVKSKL